VTERLWAPWRLEYVQGGGTDDDAACIFCLRADGSEDDLIVHRGRHAYVLMNLFPYSNGHVMVAPYRHLADPAALEPDEQAELWSLFTKAMAAMRTAMQPHGFNAGFNLGRVAGAGVIDHLHLHVVPRWGGDTNFMPVLADVKVMPEHITRTAQKLRDAWPG